MSMMLYNPTSETFEMQYGGKTMFLEGGAKLKVEDAAAHHLLNAFTPRGLCSLEFGDEEEVIGADGIQRNLEFRKRMVMQHNHRNVVRKQQGLSYMEPSEYIKQAALDLAIDLDQPYAPKDKEQSRIHDLEGQISTLTSLVNKLLAGAEDAHVKTVKGRP